MARQRVTTPAGGQRSCGRKPHIVIANPYDQVTTDNRRLLQYGHYFLRHAILIPSQSTCVCCEASSHRSPTCATQAPVLHSAVPQDVLQTASYTDLDLLDRSASPCSLCNVSGLSYVWVACRHLLPLPDTSPIRQSRCGHEVCWLWGYAIVESSQQTLAYRSMFRADHLAIEDMSA